MARKVLMALQGEPCGQAIVLQSLYEAGVVWASGIFSPVQLGASMWPLTLVESFLEKTLQGPRLIAEALGGGLHPSPSSSCPPSHDGCPVGEKEVSGA